MHYVPFEETWRDTCVHLNVPQLKGRRTAAIADLLEPLEKRHGGRVFLDKSGRFYLKSAAGNMEMQLVSEGLRKLAMLAQPLAAIYYKKIQALRNSANLNPKLIKLMLK